MRTQAVIRAGAASFDRGGNRVDGPDTVRDLIVIPTQPFTPPGPVTQSPAILSRAEIARRRDAHLRPPEPEVEKNKGGRPKGSKNRTSA